MTLNLRPYLKLARISDWRGYFLGGTFGFLLAIGWRAPLGDIISLFVIGILLLTFGFSINDFFDVEGDKLKKDKIIIIGKKVSVKRAFFFSLFSAVLGLALSLRLGFMAFFDAFLAVFLVFLYSVPPVRLKSRPFLDLLSHGFFAGILIFLFPLFAFSPAINSLDKLLVVPIFILSITAEMRNHLNDYEIDKKEGLKTTVCFLGYRNSQKILRFLFFLYPLTLLPAFWLLGRDYFSLFLLITIFFSLLLLGRKNHQSIRDWSLMDGYTFFSFLFILIVRVWDWIRLKIRLTGQLISSIVLSCPGENSGRSQAGIF